MRIFHTMLLCASLVLFHPNKAQPDCQSTYIVSQNNGIISILDYDTDATTGTIDLGMVAPREIAFTPDRTRAYVSNQGGDSVSVIDIPSNTVIATIPLGVGVAPVGIATSSTHVYVVGNGDSMIHVIEIATNTLIASILVPSGSLNDLAVTQDETRVYITSVAGVVEIMDIPSNVLLAMPVMVGGNPQGVAMTSTTAYVANQSTGEIHAIDLATLAVTNSPVSFPLAQDIAITPDGTKAYVSAAGGGTDVVYILDIPTLMLAGTIPLPGGSTASYQVAVSPDGTKAIVTNNMGNTITTIDVATDTPVTSMLTPALDGPFGIGFSCSISGSCRKNIFLTQIDRTNQISWFPIYSTVPVEYQVFRNGQLIGTVSSTGPYQFSDSNKRNAAYVYSVYAKTSTNRSLIGIVSTSPCR